MADGTRPGAPSVTAAPGDTEVVLSWSDPDDASIDHYEVRRGAGVWADITGSSATTTSLTITGLENGTSYSFRVRAVDVLGAGAASNTATVTPASADTTGPSVIIGGVPDRINSTALLTVTFTFDEAVRGFTADDVAVANGLLDTLTETTTGTVRTAAVTPNGGSDLTVEVGARSVTDGHGNAGPASAVAETAIWDITAPAAPSALTLQNPSSSPGNGCHADHHRDGRGDGGHGDPLFRHRLRHRGERGGGGHRHDRPLHRRRRGHGSSDRRRTAVTYRAKHTDGLGNASTCSIASVTYTYDITGPTVASVAITSNAGLDSTYAIGRTRSRVSAFCRRPRPSSVTGRAAAWARSRSRASTRVGPVARVRPPAGTGRRVTPAHPDGLWKGSSRLSGSGALVRKRFVQVAWAAGL